MTLVAIFTTLAVTAAPIPAAATSESAIEGPRLFEAFEVIETTAGPMLVPSATTQQNVIILTNRERARVGLPPVRYSQAVTIAAQRHANDMARMLRLTHTGSDGSNGGTRIRRAGYSWRRWGENIAAGYTSSSSVVSAWMQSSGHRSNMLNRSFTHIGIGMAWGGGRIWWVMDLAG